MAAARASSPLVGSDNITKTWRKRKRTTRTVVVVVRSSPLCKRGVERHGVRRRREEEGKVYLSLPSRKMRLGLLASSTPIVRRLRFSLDNPVPGGPTISSRVSCSSNILKTSCWKKQDVRRGRGRGRGMAHETL